MASSDDQDDRAPDRRPSRVRPVIVGVGASAGGIQALRAFFEALPSDTGATFVVVVHLDPQNQSEVVPRGVV